MSFTKQARLGLNSLVVCFCVLVSPAWAQDSGPSAKIVEYGRYQGKVLGVKPSQDTSGSVIIESKELQHVETTKKIPARVGEFWGFRVEYDNLPRKGTYRLRSETHHPPIKQPDGKSLTKSVQQWNVRAGTRPNAFFLWRFQKDFEYELVP